MLPVSKEEIKKLIEEGRAEKKDVSGLVAQLENMGKGKKESAKLLSKTCGITKTEGETIYVSTGPFRKDDFDGLD